MSMNGRFLAALYMVPAALMSVYGRPFFGDVWAFAIIVVYLALPFAIIGFLRRKDKNR
jgi:hypothetical protein